MEEQTTKTPEEKAPITRLKSLIFKGRYAQKGKTFFIVQAQFKKRMYSRALQVESHTTATVTNKQSIKETVKIPLSEAHQTAIYEELEAFLLKDMGLLSSEF